MAENKLTDQSVSEIDKALAAAKARKAAKTGATGTTGEKPAKAAKTPKAPAAPKEPKRPRLTDEEKAARIAARETERAARKATRETARAAKLAERAANRQPAHMRKVQKAAEKLGALNETSQVLFDDATSNLPASQVAILALHLQHFNRVKATERALGQTIEAGQSVTIVGGDPRFIGKTGIVFKAQRIRCYVTVEGFNKPVYLFTSDVQVNAAAPAAATA
jgi:hypothetical protein